MSDENAKYEIMEPFRASDLEPVLLFYEEGSPCYLCSTGTNRWKN